MSVATAVTIGNFDGVHRGHAALIAAARAAVSDAGRVVVMTLDPHPATVLRPGVAVNRISTFEQRAGWLTSPGVGADAVVRLEPTREFLLQSPEEFIAKVVAQCKPQFVVEGGDFRFGRARAGSIETLKAAQSQHGFRVIVVDEVEAAMADQSLVRVSSTMIRWLLMRGRVNDAMSLLGRPYEIVAKVSRGDQRGRELGFPTANLDHGDFVLPADGIYAGEATRPDGKRYAAAISVGTKPTFGENARVCEAHLLGFDGPMDEYGWTIQLRFERWLRDQLMYPSVEPLVEQLRRDVAMVGE
jgi:riboflavin kinase/FMN adenylyltransferase